MYLILCQEQEHHLDIRAAGHLNAGSTVSNDVVLGYLPAAAETDTVAAVPVNAVATELHSAVPLHDNAAAAIVLDAIRRQPCQLAALEHGDARAAVVIDEVGEDVEWLAALHIETDCCGQKGGERVAGCRTQTEEGSVITHYPHCC